MFARPALIEDNGASTLQRSDRHQHTVKGASCSQTSFEIPCFASAYLSTAFSMDVSICDVTLGPTASWKDCVAPDAIETALRQGLQRVVVASSGNHGRAIAFACRAASMRAAVLTYDRTPPDIVASLKELGADVFLFPDRAAVHAALDCFVSNAWFSATLTDRLRHHATMPGSLGYRRIAVAITELGAVDPIVVVPTCYGDGASSLRGHLVDAGCDPLLCLVRASAGGGSVAASIATDVVTPQVSDLLERDALDVWVDDRSFHVGRATMDAALKRRLDCAEGGIPEALARIAAMGAPLRHRPIVCVVTGSTFLNCGHDQQTI